MSLYALLPFNLSAEERVVKSMQSDPRLSSPERTQAQQDVTASLEENSINKEKILESAAKHMTEETHG